MANTGVYNPAKVEQEIVDVAKQMLQENDDIGAILLECTELSPHAVAVQNAVRMPVWDYTTLIVHWPWRPNSSWENILKKFPQSLSDKHLSQY